MAYSSLYANFFSVCQRTGSAVASLWRFSPTRFYLLAILLLQALAWWGAFFIYRNLAGDILVLHYNVDFGIDLIGTPQRIFFYPMFGLGITLLNLAGAAFFTRHKDFRIFAHLLMAASVNFGLILSFALFFIYFINFK